MFPPSDRLRAAALVLWITTCAACGAEPWDAPVLHEVFPAQPTAGSRQLISLRGDHFLSCPCQLELRSQDGGNWQMLENVQRLSDRLILAVLPPTLSPGLHDLRLVFADGLPLSLPAAVELRQLPSREDGEAPDIWITSPDPSLGVRAGSVVDLEVHARDVSGVSSIGYEATGLVELSEDREVSSGGTRAWTRFQLSIPESLQPLQLFWVVPRAADRLGNAGNAAYAVSIILCGDPGPDSASEPLPCQN